MELFIAKTSRFPALICLLFIIFISLGIYCLCLLPIDAFPDLTNNQVQIMTEAPGMGPVEVEQLITIPLESIMRGLPAVKQFRSISKYGLSVVTIVFPDQFGIYFPRQLVLERLQAARSRLPEKIEPQLGPISTALGEIYQYTLTSVTHSLTDLKTIQEWDIKSTLRSVPGVADVNTWGGFTDEYLITVLPAKLQFYGITVQEVMEALKNNNENFGAGIINHESEQFIVRGLGRANSIDDIENIVVKSTNSVPIYIRNLGTVTHGTRLRQGAATRDGMGEAVVGLIMMLKGENSLQVIGRVKEKIAQITANLSHDISLQPFYDQTKLVEQTIDTVRTNLLEGGLLVILVLLLTVGNFRAAFIVAMIIPLSMTFSFLGMHLLGVTANIMSLGAIDFGMIVDGSIVMVENILHNLNKKELQHLDKLQVIEFSIAEVARPILFGILIITVVYIPILCLEGLEYKMFSPMVITVCSALIGSLLLSLFMVPIFCRFLLPRHPFEKETLLIRAIRSHYTKQLDIAMKNKTLVIGFATMLLTISLASLFFIGTEFVPKLDEGDLLIEVKEFPSISLPAAIQTATLIEKTIKELPEVKTVVCRLGRPDLATDPMGVYGTDCFIILKAKKEWRAGLAKEQLITELREKLNNTITGATFNFNQPIAMRVDELVSGVRADLAIKIIGDDMDYLQHKAEEIRHQISNIPGVVDLQIERLTGSQQIEVIPDRIKLARYGINIEDIRVLLQTAVIGQESTQIIQERKRFDIRIQFPHGERLEPSDIGNLLVEGANKQLVPLSQLAEIKIAQTLETINRESGQRRIVIQCNVKGRDLGSFVRDCQQKVNETIKLNQGYYISWSGEFENEERAMNNCCLLCLFPFLLFLSF